MNYVRHLSQTAKGEVLVCPLSRAELMREAQARSWPLAAFVWELGAFVQETTCTAVASEPSSYFPWACLENVCVCVLFWDKDSLGSTGHGRMGLKYLPFTHDIGGSIPSTAKEIKSFILFWVSEMGPQSVNPGCAATDYLDLVNFELVVITCLSLSRAKKLLSQTQTSVWGLQLMLRVRYSKQNEAN